MFNQKEYSKQYYLDHKDKIKKYHHRYLIERNYSLSYKEWLKMWENQNGKCAICGKEFKNKSDACIDHDHKTDNIRGLLCKQCNFGIGLFNDKPELLIKVADYLLLYKL